MQRSWKATRVAAGQAEAKAEAQMDVGLDDTGNFLVHTQNMTGAAEVKQKRRRDDRKETG